MAQSDVEPGSQVHSAIGEMLSYHGLNVAVWYYKSKSNSRAARANADGSNDTCPALHISFKHINDVTKEQIDVRNGNWNDEWSKTTSVRSGLNQVLAKAELGPDFISDQTFIFVLDSWENIVLDHLGRIKKDEVTEMISKLLPSEPKFVFWNSSRTYNLIFKNGKGCKMALPFKQELESLTENILSKADPENHSLSHKVKMSFAYMGMKNLNLYGLSRQD